MIGNSAFGMDLFFSSFDQPEPSQIMIDSKTGQPDPDHPHIRQLAQLRPDQLRGFAMKLDEISDGLFQAARQPRVQALSLTGANVPAWLTDLYNKFGPIVMDLLRAYFLREAGVDIGAGSLQSQPAVAGQSGRAQTFVAGQSRAESEGRQPT